MNKKILIVLIVLALLIPGVIYLDRVILQTRVKAFLIREMEAATGKKVAVASVNFNIFKGLVLRDLLIYENNIAIISAKEVSATVLIPPLFRREVIIPSIRVNAPEIFLERRADNSVNIIDLFTKSRAPAHKFNFLVRRVILRAANVNFHDDTLTPPFTRRIDRLNLDAYLSLPAGVRFDLAFCLPDDPSVKIGAKGEYDIIKKEFRAEMKIEGLSPGQLGRYYERSGFSIPEGRCGAVINMIFKDNILDADVKGETKGLVFSKDNVTTRIDSDIKARVKYDFGGKELIYSGNADVTGLALSGIETVDTIDNVRGNFIFNNSGLSSEDVSAEVLGFPVKGRFALADFSSPVVSINVNSDLSLEALQDTLEETFKIIIPAEMEGRGKLYVTIEYEPSGAVLRHMGGALDMAGAKIIFDRKKPPLEGVTGRFNFTQNQLVWPDLRFRYQDTSYETSGMLTNFTTPGVQMKLSSKDLALESVFGINGKLITFSKLSGAYCGSGFALEGSLDLTDGSSPNMALSGTADIRLDGLKELLKKSREKIEKMKLAGVAHAEFSLNGNPDDIRSCEIDAKLSSESLSIYDFKASNVFVNYRQKGGIAEIPFARAVLYGGAMDATARMDLLSKDLAYSVNADMDGVKIELVKMDTAFKDKDIAGLIRAKAKFNGHSNDMTRFTGSGRITISNGKLWQFNLFQGLGMLLFTSDFSDIIFSEGTCDFVIRDKAFSADNVMLKSDLLNLYGPVKIDFNNSINAELKAELQAAALAPGARKNLVTAIGKYSLIGITGTLRDPKYRFKPDVGGIIEDIRDRVFAQ